MNILADERERSPDSPYIASISTGRTATNDTVIRPAECQWHLVLVRYQGNVQFYFVAPLTTSGRVTFVEGAEILWIKFKLGTFMPHLPARDFLDVETFLPGAASQSFWLKGSAWQFPHYENVDTFVNRLVRAEVLARDPVVNAVLEGQPHEMSARTVRHRFLRATGLTLSHIRQVQRAQWAAALLKQGVSIPDTVYEAGYFDQPHLTRSLKQWVGHTPAQISRLNKPACHSIQDGDPWPDYDTGVLANGR